MSKVGIVILNYNASKYLDITLYSICKSKTKLVYSIGVIDNGSTEVEKEKCFSIIKKYKEQYSCDIKFFNEPNNLGFSGGNNVVIKYFLEMPDITHICLLNSDVIVTDNWLDYLIARDADVIGPVTNAAGNEQTIKGLSDVELEEASFESVNEYADYRHISFEGYTVESDLVTFFATLIKRQVIEKVGLLDEQFYPGSYEDDDYCVRILKNDFSIYIARDCYIHHFGSGSFSKLKMSDRKDIGIVNRERFEKKWNTPWKDRTWKLLLSCRQDVDFLLAQNVKGCDKSEIINSLKDIERIMTEWGEAIQFFTSQKNQDSSKPDTYNYSIKQLVKMIYRKFMWELSRRKKKYLNKFYKLISFRRINKIENESYSNVRREILKNRKDGKRAVCVFAPIFNELNEKDGYIQRIKTIDTMIFSSMYRVYLCDGGNECDIMNVDFVDDSHCYITFNSHNPRNLKKVFELAQMCGVVYTHSILRFMGDISSKALWKIFDLDNVKHFWDVHGAVPEEYVLSGAKVPSVIANKIERIMAEKVDVIIVVTHAMETHLKNKYSDIKAKFVVLPILNHELLDSKKYDKNLKSDIPSIVYAGGLQPWQNIDLMNDIIEKLALKFEYRIYVPNPDAFMKTWGERRTDIDMVVESKSQEELYKEYANCDFGFILRDTSPVNSVACPTKMIEYLRFGIIPILKSAEIGDFCKLGMKYLTYKELFNDHCLTREERETIIMKNYEVLINLKNIYEEGIKSLTDLIGGCK